MILDAKGMKEDRTARLKVETYKHDKHYPNHVSLSIKDTETKDEHWVGFSTITEVEEFIAKLRDVAMATFW